MKILEVRESFIKIESEKKVSVSSFLRIKNDSKSYIAQVIQAKKLEECYIVIAKILFLYDGEIQNYDGTFPETNSEIGECTGEILNKTLVYNRPVVAGKFIDGSFDITIDKECFNNKTLISTDTPKYTETILTNLAHQFKKSLIIDMSGVTTCKKFIAGRDFKLPLNTASLEFMYEDCLNDATTDSKNLIKEIFNDLSEYSKTVDFLPFGALKTIVDNMVDREHIFKLLVLKNKLAKFDKQGYFAIKQEEAKNLQKILNLDNAVIDLSKLDTIFQNRYLKTIYALLEEMDAKPQVFIRVTNAIDKKNIKNIITNSKIPAVFATHSKFKYLNEIKSMFDNFVIEPTFTNNEVFKIYSAFLKSMSAESCLIVGEGTNYIPLVSSVEEYSILPTEEVIEEESKIPEPEENLEVNEVQDNTSLEEIAEAEEAPDVELNITSPEDNLEISSEEEAIEKKSEAFIEQAASESLETPLDIFAEEQAEETEVEAEEQSSEEEDDDEEILEETEPEITEDSEIHIEDGLELTEPISLEDEQEETLIEEADSSEILSETESESEEFHTETDDIQTIEIPEDISEFAEMEEVQEENIKDNNYSDEVQKSFAERMETEEISLRDYSEEKDLQDDIPDVIPLENTEDEEGLDEIVELDESELGDDDIIVDFEDDALESDDLDKEIVEDVDKVFTTIKDDSISDSDLDFIDELNETAEEEQSLPEGMEELTEFKDDESEDGFLEPLEEINELEPQEEEKEEKEILETRNTSTPIVPVYDAEIPPEDMVMSDAIEQGDTVTHSKYGTGVVEKMIKYGTKTLYSINFDNVGRRLLDPTLTEIKKA